jgi:outer membrane protein OmpA-like peptidoglycan-associated protein/tetratricopeptide (TPR) repeat protein
MHQIMMNRYTFFLGFSFLIFNVSFTQVEDESCLPPSKKVLKMINEGKAAPDPKIKSEFFTAAMTEDPDNAMAYYEIGMYAYQKAESISNTNNATSETQANKFYQSAETRFKEALDRCSDYHGNCFFYLGYINYKQGELEESIKWFKAFVDYKKLDPEHTDQSYAEQLAYAKKGIDIIQADIDLNNNKVPFTPSIVKNVSNLELDDYFPMISPDNEVMFYTRKVDKRGLGEVLPVWREEFSFSLRPDISHLFDKGAGFEAPFNTGEFKSYGAATMSVDNKEMIICACKEEMQTTGSSAGQMYLNCDLYRTEFERSGMGGNDFTWTNLERLGPGINTPNGWEGQPTLSADGNTMYYTAMRPTTNDNDIFVVERGKDGKWGNARPFNEINTLGKDKSPFLHQDSESLYFVSTCSETRKGAGGLDIFYIRKVDGAWSKPKNIGIPINTTEDELGIFVSTNGELAYYSSRTGGNWNIYSFELYEEARPSAVTIMKGTLNDENGNPIKDASIEVAYAGSTEKSTVKVNGDDGKYAVVVKNPTKQDVMVTVKKEGYAFDSKLITKEEFVTQVAVAPKDVALANVVNPKVSSPKVTTKPSSAIASSSNTPVSMPKVNLEVKKLKVGAAYTLNDILFDPTSFVLSERSKFILREFSSFLIENPTITIMVQGHTDDIGDDASNLILSDQRAKAVKDYLVSLKINTNRLTSKGFGETLPKVANDTDKNRAKNRRTDFVIVKI